MNLSPINAHLTERRVALLAGAVEALEAGVAVGMVANKVFVDAKDTINSACKEGTEAFLAAGPHVVGRNGQPHHQSDFWLDAYDADAFVYGASNVATALKRSQKVAGLKDYAAFLTALMPLVDLLAAAKPLIKKRGELPKVVTPKQAAKLAKAMTCQCCARQIFAETGVIAHHGYERPGFGYQTASCMGARELPFEVSRDALAYLIAQLRRMETEAVSMLAAVANGLVPIRCEFTDYDAPRDKRTGYRPTKSFDVTRANFDEVQAANRDLHGDFDNLMEKEVRRRSAELKNLRDEIKAQKARFDGWKQTHAWDSDAQKWKAV